MCPLRCSWLRRAEVSVLRTYCTLLSIVAMLLLLLRLPWRERSAFAYTTPVYMKLTRSVRMTDLCVKRLCLFFACAHFAVSRAAGFYLSRTCHSHAPPSKSISVLIWIVFGTPPTCFLCSSESFSVLLFDRFRFLSGLFWCSS